MVQSPVEPEAPQMTRINLEEDYELVYWTARLGCTSRQLREAVRAVGPVVSNVIAWLREQEGR